MALVAGAGRRCTYAVCTYLLTYLLTMETTSLGTHLETSFIYLRQRGAPRGERVRRGVSRWR